MTPKEVMEQAVILIETNGWFGKGGSKHPKEVCLVYALSRVSGYPTDMFKSEFHEAYRILLSIVPKEFKELIRWNDAEGRTKEEVIELLRKGIKACE